MENHHLAGSPVLTEKSCVPFSIRWKLGFSLSPWLAPNLVSGLSCCNGMWPTSN